MIPQVMSGSNCPQCNVGFLQDDYGIGAILLAILFFPLGVLCCLALGEVILLTHIHMVI